MSSRVAGGVLGYFIPFILFFVLLFALEWFIELTLGIIGMMVGSTIQPNFPGPTDLIQSAIYLFPDVWDLGTAFYFGGIGELVFIFYVFIAILDGLVVVGSLKALKSNLKEIYSDALLRAGTRFGALAPDSSSTSTSTSSSGDDPPDTKGGEFIE